MEPVRHFNEGKEYTQPPIVGTPGSGASTARSRLRTGDQRPATTASQKAKQAQEEAARVEKVHQVALNLKKVFEQHDSLAKLFRSWDMNHDGSLTAEEFKNRVNDYGMNATTEDIDLLMRYLEWLPILKQHKVPSWTSLDLSNIYCVLCADVEYPTDGWMCSKCAERNGEA